MSADTVLLLPVTSCCFMPQLSPFPPLPETCKRPRWDPGLHLEPDLQEYKKNEEVMLSCPEGLQPSYTQVRCSREVQIIINGKPVYREVWLGRASSGSWIRIRSRVECVGKEGFRLCGGEAGGAAAGSWSLWSYCSS